MPISLEAFYYGKNRKVKLLSSITALASSRDERNFALYV
jgi:hypothetical protein